MRQLLRRVAKALVRLTESLGVLVCSVLLIGFAWLVRLSTLSVPAVWPRAVAYCVGSISAFWVIERTLGVFA